MQAIFGTSKWASSTWQKHGWWIEDDGSQSPVLYCSLSEISPSGLMTGLGQKMGIIKAVGLPNPSTAAVLFITVEDEVQELLKYRLNRHFMMSEVSIFKLHSGVVKLCNMRFVEIYYSL